MTDDLDRVRQRRERRRSTTPVGALATGGRRQAQITRVMDKVRHAEKLNGPPTPERVTMALDLCDLYGPEVDEQLGGEEPMVDEWETGERIPTKEQMKALVQLTGFPLNFFYLPPPITLTGVWLCGDDGCEPLTLMLNN